MPARPSGKIVPPAKTAKANKQRAKAAATLLKLEVTWDPIPEPGVEALPEVVRWII